jgi:hypothetical protein
MKRWSTFSLSLSILALFLSLSGVLVIDAQEESASPQPSAETTEAPLASETPQDNPPVETSIPSQTEEASPNPPETENPQATLVSPETSPTETEAVLQLLVREFFDNGDLSPWNLGEAWSLVPNENGLALQVSNSDVALQYQKMPFYNLSLEARFLFDAGSVQIRIRQNSAGYYALVLNTDGNLSLYHNELLLQTVQAAPNQAGQWRTITLTAVENRIRVALDNVELINLVDSNASTLGTISIAGSADNRLLVDDFFVWVPQTEIGNYPAPTPYIAPQTPIPNTAIPSTSTPMPSSSSQISDTVKDLSPFPAPSPQDIQAHLASTLGNDNFSGFTINTFPFTVSDNTIGDTVEVNEANPSCGFGVSNTVWFSFTPSETGSYSVSLAGSDFDTILAIYTGASVDSLSQVSCNDDLSPTNLTSYLQANLTSGTEYRIQIGGFNGRYGNYSLAIYRLGLAIPAAPSLASPANASRVNDLTPNVSWTTVANAASYEIQWATNATFTLNVGSTTVAAPTTTGELSALPATPDTLYYWRVRALNISNQAGPYSASRTFTLDTLAPNAPTLSLPADLATVSNSKPSLTWLAVTGATSYLVDVDNDEDFSSPVVENAVVTVASFVPANPLVQGTYYWRVQARDVALNIGTESNVRSFTVNILTAPLNNAVITANISNQASPLLTWAAVTGVTSYTVLLDDENTFTDPIEVNLGNVTTYTVSPALNIGQYYWQVFPTGYAPATPVYRRFIVSPPPLPAPSLSSPANSAKINDSTPNLSWTVVANASQYEVQWSTSATFASNVQSTMIDGTNTDLSALPDTASTLYYWRVRTINSVGVAGAFSLSRSFTLDNLAPAVPTLSLPANAAMVSNPKPSLTWLAVTGATNYLVELDNDSDFSSPIASDTVVAVPSFMPASPLTQGTYYWRVQARDASLNLSIESAVRSFTVNILLAPLNNAAVLANASNQASPVLRWTAVTGVTSYTVILDNENTFTDPIEISLGNVTTYTVSPALGTGQYYWQVIPTGYVPATPVFNSFIVSPAPLAAPSLSLPANAAKINDTTPNLSWASVANASQYELQWSTSATFATNVQSTTTASTNADLPLLPDSAGTMYYWRVRSINNLGVAGAFSLARNFTLDNLAPAAPTLSMPANAAIVSNPKPSLSWLAVTGATSYLVELDNDSNFSSPIALDTAVAVTSFLPASPLTQGTYYWRVQARDAALNVSTESAVRSFTVNILLAPLNNAVITAGISNTAAPVLRWTAVPGVTSYKVILDSENTFTDPLEINLGNVTTYTVSPALVTGAYYWQVIPTGYVPATPVFNSFIVSPPALVAPSLLSPATGAKINDTTPNLAWSSVTNASQYELQWSTSATFTTNIQSITTGSTNADLPLLPDSAGTIYYWRVRSINNLGVRGAFSLPRNFTLDTLAPPVPVLSTPANNTSVTTNPPTFIWLASTGAASYQIRYGTTLPLTLTVSNIALTSFRPATPLLLRDYYWQVQAVDAAGNLSGWSAVRTVKISSLTTAAPILNRYTTSTPTLSWSPVTWTASGGYYQVQVDNLSTFASPEFVSGNIPTGTQTVTTSALANGQGYWRVRACTSANVCGAWSPAVIFTVEQ